MPAKPLDHLALMDATGAEPDEPGKVGAVPVGTGAEAKENLKQFIESMHQKASSVVQWLGQIDEDTNERCKKLLGSKTN